MTYAVRYIKRVLCAIITIAFLPLFAFSQSVNISGKIYDAATGKPVESAMVMLQNRDGRTMYGYAITQADGCYSIGFNSKADTLQLAVTGFNIKAQRRVIAARTQRVDFAVESAELQIREVVVKAPAVERQSDTLTYTVEKYRSVADRSIGDVLKKMPGIEVAQSGEIKYQGKAINRFYVEDLDMLGGRYGIATNNIQAKDIARVELYENHQPVKALKGLSDSDRAAINLRLKDSAKGAWSGTMQLGAGYKPWMWNGEATAMYFSRRFQTINTYKTNNAGDDVARELTDFSDGMDPASSLLGVHQPTRPALDQSRYLDNAVHVVTLNTITKLDNGLDLTTNANYTHDYQLAEGESVTTYYLPEQPPLVVREVTDITRRTDRAEADLQLRANTDKRYLQEKLSFAGNWDHDFGQVVSDGQPVSQHFRLPRIAVRNRFNNVRRFGSMALSLYSNTDYSTQPAVLRIEPMRYPEVFGNPDGYPDALQTLDSRRFRTNNTAYTSWTLGRWTISLNGSLHAQIEWMQSALAPMNAAGETLVADDAMRNDIYWRRVEAGVGPGVRYNLGDRLSMHLNMPVAFIFLRSEDRVRERISTQHDVMLRPSFSMQSTLSRNLKFQARASYYENVGGLYDNYGGFIMTDYRMISSKEGDISRNRTQSYAASLNYGNAIRALFASLDAGYRRTRRNLLYGVSYEGSLSTTEAIAIDNLADGYDLGATFSKRFDGIATTFNLSGGFARSWAEVLRQGVLLPTQYDQTRAALGFNTRFTQAVLLNYEASWTRSISRFADTQLNPIDVLRQRASFDIIIRKKLICRIGGEHCYNAAIGGADRNMYFLDATLSYKGKRIEYLVEARNLLDTGYFRSASQSDITDYIYSYRVRPASVMFKIKFSLR